MGAQEKEEKGAQTKGAQTKGGLDMVDDEKNPKYIFSTVDTSLLVEAMNDHFNLHDLAMGELRNRGYDENGDWVGFGKGGTLDREYFDDRKEREKLFTTTTIDIGKIEIGDYICTPTTLGELLELLANEGSFTGQQVVQAIKKELLHDDDDLVALK